MNQQSGSTTTSSSSGGGGLNRDQLKKMSEADKEMELRANRAKALLAERHIGLKTNQVSSCLSIIAMGCIYVCCAYLMSIISLKIYLLQY